MRILAAIGVSLLVFSGCASEPQALLTSTDLFRTCGQVRFEGQADEPLVLNPIPDDVRELLDQELERIDAIREIRTDVTQWYLAERTEDSISVVFKRPNGDADSYTQGHLKLTDEGEWHGRRWGPCEIRFGVDGRHPLGWTLVGQVNSSTSVVRVSAMSVCGPHPIDGSQIESLLVSDADRVSIVLIAPLVDSSSDSADLACRNGREQLVDVDLGEALGNRELHDGSTPSIGSLRYPSQ